ncbi:MAG: taurine dioxygenase [Rhodospirillaceae bacterium]|jgi:taurine dioxygenase|nr:taurine dioxygenase [Rhodospirillaceae bacterium]MBT6138259.1 taurine dioxygenase [Rhodospirillaceae bacterium]
MKNSRFTVTPLAGAIGAEIGGVDLSRDTDDAAIAELRAALLTHGVIFLRDQELTPASQMEFARKFGTPAIYPFVQGLEDFPEITPIIKQEDETVNFGGLWHTDTAYLERPPLGTILYALEVPAAGGDTEWASLYAAYDALSDGMKQMLEPLRAVNRSEKGRVAQTRASAIASSPTDLSNTELVAEHPVVRTHPETGRKALYVNLAHTSHFVGMTEAESKPILDYLFELEIRPEFTCRFHWRSGSIAIWDNRCTLHNPINDYQGSKRVMHRVTLEGDVPA